MAIPNPIVIPMTVTTDRVYIPIKVAAAILQSQVEDYDGAYEVTPTQGAQILYTENKRAVQNITINPIPSNYGLIVWNGSVLTVS